MNPQTARKDLKKYIEEHGLESLLDELTGACNEIAKGFKECLPTSHVSPFWFGMGEKFTSLHRWVVRK